MRTDHNPSFLCRILISLVRMNLYYIH